MRIVKTRNKFFYFVVTFGLLTAFTLLVSRPYLPIGIGQTLLQTARSLLIYAGAVRWFRGPGEDVVAPRPWWRASNRPTASFVLAALIAASWVYSIVEFTTGRSSSTPFSFALTLVTNGFLIYYYVNSGVRLNRLHLPPKIELPRPNVAPTADDAVE